MMVIIKCYLCLFFFYQNKHKVYSYTVKVGHIQTHNSLSRLHQKSHHTIQRDAWGFLFTVYLIILQQ